MKLGKRKIGERTSMPPERAWAFKTIGMEGSCKQDDICIL